MNKLIEREREMKREKNIEKGDFEHGRRKKGRKGVEEVGGN